MRIAIDGMLLRGNFSGVEVAIASLARALAERGREQYRLYVPPGYAGPSLPPERMRMIRSSRLTRYRPFRILWEQCALPRRLDREAVDLLHSPGYIAPLRAGVPVVLTLYDLIALLHPGWCKVSNALHYGLLLPLSVRKAAGIIVPSTATARDLTRRLLTPPDKVRVIPLGVGEEFRTRTADDEATARALRARYKLGEKFILFVGQQEPKKNLPRLLHAYRQLRSEGGAAPQLVLAGAEGWGGSAVRRTIRRLGLGEAVVCTGFIPSKELPALYRMAEVFVFPSLYEGFGLPPLEAMASGVPVVCSSAGALPETVGDAAWLVNPEDVGALTGALRRILSDAELRRSLIGKGLEQSTRFTWSRAAEATEAFFHDIFNKLRPAS